MPDDKPVDTQPQAEPEQSDLDKLFEEASRQATDPTKVSTCSHAIVSSVCSGLTYKLKTKSSQTMMV
jgi:hypothetical protein